MFIELSLLVAGIFPGWLLRKNSRAVIWVGHATMGTIYALLFILGLRLGSDEALIRALHVLGIQGLTIGFCCTMGSAVCMVPIGRFFSVRTGADTNSGQEGGFWQGMKGSLKILGCFCVGLCLGVGDFLPHWFYGGDVFLYILRAMLVCVGMCMGFDLKAFLIVRDLGLRVLLIPLLTIAGTGLGAFLASLFFADLDFRSCLGAGLGMGYYSLSTIIVTELATPALASITLIANVFRELFILLATPLLIRLLGPLAPVAGAGAPGVDVCLPGIMRFAGERYGFLALFNGMIMTMLVPVLVTLALTFGR